MSRSPIAIDARLNAYRQGGIAQYTRKLIEHLARIAPDEDWLVLAHRRMRGPLVAPLPQARLWTPPTRLSRALPRSLALQGSRSNR